jgi:hypothetical protein
MTAPGRFETYELNLIHVMWEQSAYTHELACRGDLQRLGYHKDGDILRAHHDGKARTQVEHSLGRRVTTTGTGSEKTGGPR